MAGILEFKTKSLEEYAVLIFELTNYTGKEVIQILNKDDRIILPLFIKAVTFYSFKLLINTSIKSSSWNTKFSIPELSFILKSFYQ